MADFSKKSNYNENTSFSAVRFGDKAPVLEVELNEVQEIINTKLSRLIKSVGQSVVPLSNGTIQFNTSSKVLSITNSVILEESGLTAFVNSASVTLSSTNKYAYFEVKEIDATSSTALKEYGNTTGSSVTNTMVDSRFSVETSRRSVVTYTLKAGSSVPASTDTIKNVSVGEYDEDSNSFVSLSDGSLSGRVNSLEEQLNGLSFTIEDGVLFVDDGEE